MGTDKNLKQLIQTKNCRLQKVKWAMIALTKESFKENIIYNKKCDIAGKFTVKMDEFFTVNLAIKKLSNYNNIISKIKFEIVFLKEMVLKVYLKDAELKGKKNITFNAHYSAVVDPLNQQGFIKKRLGGKLNITSINKIKISKTLILN